MPVHPVNESIREIDDNCWVVGGRILLSRKSSPSSSGPSWSDGRGSFYVISEATHPPPPSRPLPATSHIQKVYDAGGVSAVWIVGDAICKVKILDPNATREHVTLGFLHDKRPLSFTIPDVHYHAEYDDRYYIVQSRLAGETLTEVWPAADEATKQRHVTEIVNICKELAGWTADSINGVDGNHLSDGYLTRFGLPKDCSPMNLLNNCKDLGMDCSKFLFYHCDLGPGNIIVNAVEGPLGIIDWETAGFVPKEWIRTKFRVSGGMDLPGDDYELRVDWRRRVQRHLEKEGFLEIADRWMVWWSNQD